MDSEREKKKKENKDNREKETDQVGKCLVNTLLQVREVPVVAVHSALQQVLKDSRGLAEVSEGTLLVLVCPRLVCKQQKK